MTPWTLVLWVTFSKGDGTLKTIITTKLVSVPPFLQLRRDRRTFRL